MTEAVEVKANIKLRFTNRQGNPTVVVRSFSLTKKRTKMEFKALDGVVRMTDANGEKVSLTQKCSELDKHIPDLIGVSKAIMENVVFCHQEESNWPLQEGALLKKKFDDIFESTRYSKALDAISKSKKEFAARCKDLQKDVAELNAYLHSANDMRESLEINQHKVSECSEELDAVELNLERTDEKLKVSREEVKRVETMQQALQQLEWQVDELTRRAEEKKSSLEQVFDESDKDLEAMFQNFDQEMDGLRGEFGQIQELVDGCAADTTRLRTGQSDLNRQHGEIVVLERQLAEQTNSAYESMRNFSRSYSLTAAPISSFKDGTPWDAKAGANFIKACRAHVDGLVDDMNKTIEHSREAVRASEATNMTAKSSLQNLKLTVGEKNRELSRVETDRAAIKRELAGAGGVGTRGSAKNRRQEAETEFTRVSDEMTAYQESANVKVNRIKAQIVENSDRLRDLDSLIAQDDNALRELSLNRAEMERLNAIERQCSVDDDACLSDAATLLAAYVQLLPPGAPRGGVPGSLGTVKDVSLLADALAVRVREQKEAQASKRASIDSTKRKVYQCSAALESDEKRQVELRNKLAASATIVRSLGDFLVKVNAWRREEQLDSEAEARDLTTEDPAEAIEACMHEVEEGLANMCMFHESSGRWRDKVIKRAGKSKGTASASSSNKLFVCPCCDRGMDNDEKTNFNEKVNELFKFNPAEFESSKQRLEEFKELHGQTLEVLKKLRPFAEYKIDLVTLDARVSQQKAALNEARYQTVHHAHAHALPSAYGISTLLFLLCLSYPRCLLKFEIFLTIVPLHNCTIAPLLLLLPQ
jgi:DNA repair protein RAD50